MAYLYFSIIALAVFFVTVFLYIESLGLASKLFPNFATEKIIFAVPVAVFAPMIFFIKLLAKNTNDYLFIPSDALICIACAGAFLTGLCGLGDRTDKLSVPVLALVCTGIAFCLPDDFVLNGLSLTVIQRNIAVASALFVTAIGCAVIAKTDGLLSVYTSFVMLCVVGFYAVSGVSFMQLLSAGIMLGISCAYMLFNWKPAKMQMNLSSALSFGLLFGFLLLGCSAEGMWLPIQVILLYLYIVIAVCVLRKISFVSEAVTEKNQITECLKITFILAVFAFVQIYAEISKNLFIVAIFFIFWLQTKGEKKKSFREINRETVENVKSGIEDFRNFWDKK